MLLRMALLFAWWLDLVPEAAVAPGACLCATDNQQSFSATLAAPNDPALAPPLTNSSGTDPSVFREGTGWSYIGSPPPLSSCLLSSQSIIM